MHQWPLVACTDEKITILRQKTDHRDFTEGLTICIAHILAVQSDAPNSIPVVISDKHPMNQENTNNKKFRKLGNTLYNDYNNSKNRSF